MSGHALASEMMHVPCPWCAMVTLPEPTSDVQKTTSVAGPHISFPQIVVSRIPGGIHCCLSLCCVLRCLLDRQPPCCSLLRLLPSFVQRHWSEVKHGTPYVSQTALQKIG